MNTGRNRNRECKLLYGALFFSLLLSGLLFFDFKRDESLLTTGSKALNLCTTMLTDSMRLSSCHHHFGKSGESF